MRLGDIRAGSIIRLKGVKWTIEGWTGTKISMTSESGKSYSGPVDLDRDVDLIMEADPSVSACCEVSGAPPMDAARVAVQVHLGAVAVGELHPDGSWSCPATDDPATLAVHRLMFHAATTVEHSDLPHPAGMPVHDHK